MREYINGIYVPVIGYLEQQGSLTLEALKEYYLSNNVSGSRREKFDEWIKKLQNDRIVTIEYGGVTFNREQWCNIIEK